MGIRFFRGYRTKFEHEHRQIREIAGLLAEEYPDQEVYLLTNVLVANGELDCVVLTRSGPLILELKAYRGDVTGSENGRWEVTTRDGIVPLPNLFIQAKIHRLDLIEKLRQICRDHFPRVGEANLKKIGSWVYFCKGSRYDEGQIDLRKVKWFQVVTAENLREKIRFLESGYTLLPEDMDAIVRALRLSEYSIDTGKEVRARARPSQKPHLSRRTWRMLAIVLAIILVVAVVPPIHVAVIDSIKGTAGAATKVIHSVSGELAKANSTEEDSVAAIEYLNQIRVQNGAMPIAHNSSLFQLALVRAKDMAGYKYLDYTNPFTGSCADSMRPRYGFGPGEYVVENAYGQDGGYVHGIERQAIDSWMTRPGNRWLLLYPHEAGAIACADGYCSFLGLTPDRLFDGCQPGIQEAAAE